MGLVKEAAGTGWEVREIKQLLPSMSRTCEVQSSTVNKADGLRELCKAIDVPMQHAWAFGDDANDVRMLSEVGWGVRMANHLPALAGVGQDVTDFTNEEDGVAKYLHAHLLSGLEQLVSGDAAQVASALVQALMNHPGHAEVQRHASNALVKALESHSGHADVQGSASLALGNLCALSPERAAKAFELGAMEPLVQALESPRKVQAEGSVPGPHRLRSDSTSSWMADSMASALPSLGALDALVKALESHPSHADLQRAASLAIGELCQLCANSHERAAKAAELGALKALVQTLTSHTSNVSVQRVGIIALGNLCQDSQEHAAKAAELGALEQLVNALESHPSPSPAEMQQRDASLALVRLCGDSQHAMVKALESHFSNGGVQRDASRTLGILCNDSQERAAKAVELGALEALVQALTSHFCDNSQKRAAKAAELGALGPLVKAAELGALEAVVKALESHPSDVEVQRAASDSLEQLCANSQDRAAKAAELRVKADPKAGGTRPSIPDATPESPIEAPAALIEFASREITDAMKSSTNQP
ncbi:yitU [Symbiodinium sp. CCMP2592]|nr:yitU [Symbiodinium sp. CCMP2592]